MYIQQLPGPPKPMVSCNPGKAHASPVRLCGCLSASASVCLPKSAEVCSQVNNLLSAHNQRDSRNTHSLTQSHITQTHTHTHSLWWQDSSESEGAMGHQRKGEVLTILLSAATHSSHSIAHSRGQKFGDLK